MLRAPIYLYPTRMDLWGNSAHELHRPVYVFRSSDALGEEPGSLVHDAGDDAQGQVF